ncbi:hypothetical protein ER308_15285 [Egibacter rhizosphaerae]|uniref:Lipoprotein n=1 Tax=Egibacter rhizosphaerae TaxID=1670831 RepID=A0A411YHP7_9ACTN|nr:hypothetical protein [Egibacter rhizosphaerae]QBI20794.1 hypothetical protein ER308_15285 [Egibacter rhizosphaerae]
MRRTLTLALAAAMTLGMMAAPALAQGNGNGNGNQGGGQPDITERGNSLASQAEPVELEPGDISAGTLEDGTEFITVDHQIVADHGEYDTLVQREPTRYKGNEVDHDPGQFNAAWVGIAGPQGPEIAHKGQMTWYYDTEDNGWVSLTFQFNGKGELLHVNGVSPQE